MNSLTYNGSYFCDMEIKALNVVRGIGVATLFFSVYFDVAQRSDGDHVTCLNLRANISVLAEGQERCSLGFAGSEQALALQTYPHHSKKQFAFVAHIPFAQLIELERTRDGAGLTFFLSISGDAFGRHGHWTLNGDVELKLNESTWSKLMKDAGLRDTVMVGVDLPTESGVLSAAANSLKKASAQLALGNYEHVISLCRTALESVKKAARETGEVKEALELFRGQGGGRELMTKDQRTLAIAEAARHYAHLAVHPQDGSNAVFNRSDAIMLLTLTASIVASESARIETIAEAAKTQS